MKNVILVLISLALVCAMTLVFTGRQHEAELKQALRLEQSRRYMDVLPSDIPIRVQIVTAAELDLLTMKGEDLGSLKPYRHAILRWEDARGAFFCIVHEKEVTKEKPDWFARLLKNNGGEIVLHS